MFDTIHKHSHETRTVTEEVTIHEHRAPTDKSIELLNEFQEKAVQNIIKSIQVEYNGIKCHVVYMQDETFTVGRDRVRYFIKFNLNGKEYEVNDYIDKFEFNNQFALGHQKTQYNFLRILTRAIMEAFIKDEEGVKCLNSIFDVGNPRNYLTPTKQ